MKAPRGGGFVFEYLDHRVEFGDLQQILDTLAQAKQFKLAAVIGYSCEAGNHFADSRAVDIRAVAQVYQQLPLAFGSQIADRIPKSACALAECDTACGIDYGYVAYLAGRQFNAHEFETSLSKNLSTGFSQVLHHSYFSPAGLPATNLKLIHEVLAQKESPARLPKQVLFRQRIR